jgi:hypothetical protein
LLWLLPTLVVAGLVNGVGLGNSAERGADENTYTASAWLFDALGVMTRFSPLLDHPPLGWLQISAYTGLTGAFDRWEFAVLAGREAMLFFTLASVALLWLLARSLRLSLPAATAAALLFAVAPLGVSLHGTVSLDNVATPWLLLAFLLSMSRRRQLVAFIASGAAFSIAVFSKETFLFALPILVWVMVRSSRRRTRVYTLTAAVVTIELLLGAYFVIATVYGTGLPAGPLSRTDALPFSPVAAGAIALPITTWWQLDAPMLSVALVASLAGLLVHRTRPFAVLTLGVGALLLVPVGILPLSFVTLAIPFAALVIAGIVDAAVVLVRRGGVRRSVLPIGVVAAIAAGALVAVPLWATQLNALLTGRADDPVRDAQAWLTDNADPQQRLVVDEAMVVDLLRAGWADDTVVGYQSVASAAAPAVDLPVGWQSAAFVVTPAAAAAADAPRVREARSITRVVATFGSGADAVEVRQFAGAMDAAAVVRGESSALRRELGAELVENPAIVLGDADRALLTEGRVDERIIAVLGALSSAGDVEVAGFPVAAGEEGRALREVALISVDGQALVYEGQLTTRGMAVVDALAGPYAPDKTSIDGHRLVLRFPLPTAESDE